MSTSLRDTLASAIEYQIAKAEAGVTLPNAQAAEYATNALYNTGSTVVDAQLRTAYWLAVARRTGAGQAALDKAKALFKSAWWQTFWFEDKSASAISAVYRDAASLLAPGARYAGVASVIAIFSRLSGTGLIQATQQIRREGTPAATVAGTATQSGRDALAVITKAAETTRGIVDSSYVPPGENPFMHWLKMNAIKLMLGLIGLGVLGWVFRPYVSAAKQITGPVASGAPVRQNRGHRRKRKAS